MSDLTPRDDLGRLVNRAGNALLFILVLGAAVALAVMVNPWFWLLAAAVGATGVWMLLRLVRDRRR